jgi:hypothetical protein
VAKPEGYLMKLRGDAMCWCGFLITTIEIEYITLAAVSNHTGVAAMHSRAWKPFSVAAIAVATLMVGVAVIKVRAADSPSPAAVTIFISKGMGGSGVANALNKEHVQWYEKGYTFAAMDSYIEDGDLQGMWVTYIKKP